MSKKANLNEVKTRANFYRISGNMHNGGSTVNGKWVPNIHKAEYTRKIIAINYEKKLLICECGREFVIDDDLTLVECDY